MNARKDYIIQHSKKGKVVIPRNRLTDASVPIALHEREPTKTKVPNKPVYWL